MKFFAKQLVDWQRTHGRHHLPWQRQKGQAANPYFVWLSEVMLQQTQVATVIDYFTRFTQKFPSVQSLAAAPLDDVLSLWSGLGYYARARNLHHAARQVLTDFGGEFPKTSTELAQLKGVGRSTAAAIASLCFGERVSIMDGNVKRVLARVLGFEGDIGSQKQLSVLWNKADALVPQSPDMPAYTQGLMDLGATVCRVREPLCTSCPVAQSCKANADKAWGRYPFKTKKLKRSSESWWLLLATNATGEVLLTQRPLDAGVWAGLWTLPIFESEAALVQSVKSQNIDFLPVFKHVLTHKDIWLHVARHHSDKLNDCFDLADALALGLPAPIKKILLSYLST